MMGDTRLLDRAIGETREAITANGRVIALRIVRDSAEGRRARWGEVYAARVRSVDRRRRGAFLDLGLEQDQGFLPLDPDGRARRGRKQASVREGEAVVVSIAREGVRGKNPIVALLDEAHPGGAPARVARHDSDEELEGARGADGPTRAKLDEAIEDALSRTALIPGGGALAIEPTAALVAIDVDAGARAGSGDAERFAVELNMAAAEEAFRQLRLRSLGGIIAIDFVSMRRQASKVALEQAVRALAAADPWGVQCGPLSRFGVMELARAQLQTPLHEILCDSDGALTAETVSLMALRAVEREARASAGRKIACQVSADVLAWLDSSGLNWRSELTNQIGPRFTLEAVPGLPRTRFDVRAL